VKFRETSWILRELQPVEDRVDIAKKKQQPHELETLLRTFGDLTAWLHLRGTGRQGSATADRLIGFADDPDWRREIRDYAKGYAKQVEEDWRVFKHAYEHGALAELPAYPASGRVN
jgi:uncharacterized protein (DUF2252 family)